MPTTSAKNLFIFNVLDGLRDGLSQFSGPSRAALLYAESAHDPIRICDPENLLRGHEPMLQALYLDSDQWRSEAPDTQGMQRFGQIYPEKNLELAGLISYGGRSQSIFYQMWFTEHHPDMCSVVPTERWLEHAVWLLSHDFATSSAFYTGSSRYVLREYATHAVRDTIMDGLNLMVGWDNRLQVYPMLDAVLAISKTPEEGAWPRGDLVFVEERFLKEIPFIARFPKAERPEMRNTKHIRKLLQAVEYSDRQLVSDGRSLVGIARGALPDCRVTAQFLGSHGFLHLNGSPICSFSDGRFHSTNRRAKLVQLEEALLSSSLDTTMAHTLFQITTAIVHGAEEKKHGCTLVLDLNEPPITLSGQELDRSLDLRDPVNLDLAKSLAKVDGAIQIGRDGRLHRFACLLDGRAVPGENRARGARFNSALRFTAENSHILVVVVSADRPVSVIQDGVELTAVCQWKPSSRLSATPPTLEDWISWG
ncbi:DisA checkpoint controller nucleotide-binding [Desulfacinum hydrothermale DSM 13146]|uniref:DisA checkpoint controller nucleotide-binding n=1 Tax=Desulfacinum hydrothermale DSM 13146 TaxID=1121390 RepID=A0A1W1XI99_9BACT|nr:DNA integrity scanning protein DisA nucleotide-binding domain protein [Desulfacinum hydrothermale]SMC23715.1 DisA checkpoint controller nucleotide-binding [Desulfacinum hydrothermale DSM 13146]